MGLKLVYRSDEVKKILRKIFRAEVSTKHSISDGKQRSAPYGMDCDLGKNKVSGLQSC